MLLKSVKAARRRRGKSIKRSDGHIKRFAVLAGYLPQDSKHIDAWLKDLAKKVKSRAKKSGAVALKPSVEALRRLIERDAVVRMYVTEMVDQVPPEKKTVSNVPELLQSLDYILGHAPEYTPVKEKRNFFPMSTLFVYMMYTPAGEAAFRNAAFNNAIRVVLQEWCRFLDSPASAFVLNTGVNGWLSKSAYDYNKLDQFVIPNPNAPHWGWPSFNSFFHRQIKPEKRPIAGPGDTRVIVSANDGQVFSIQRNVKKSDTFWLKNQPYSLTDMLDNSPYTDQFVGGDVFQSFLSGANYHRWRAPIGGTVVEARIVNGLMFSELHSLGFDSDAGVLSQGYEASVNTRGLVIIDGSGPGGTGPGLVAVIPIGITEISSVTLSSNVKKGSSVKKGDQLGWFSYGGSTLALAFQKGRVKQFTVKAPQGKVPGDLINVNAQIALGY
jgi:phosphatidylserine decarboxylase